MPEITTVTCRTTRYGAGCGHPVTEHDGKPERTCCCCNRQHNDPDHAANCLDCNLRRIEPTLAEGTTSGEVAELLPEHLRQPFWRRQIGVYLKRTDGALGRKGGK